MKEATYREQILAAACQITQSKNQNEFTISEVLNYFSKQNISYNPRTIKTHISSRMCSNSPDHHGVTYNDFTRIKRGLYKINK